MRIDILLFLLFSFIISFSSAFSKLPKNIKKILSIKHAIDPINQDVISSCIALGGSAVWLKIWLQLAKDGKIDPRLSRKIIHCGSAPLFICLWPLYSSNDLLSRAIAASIPLVQITR